MPSDPLLQPLQLKHLTLKNRLMTTAHEPAYAEDGLPKDRYRLYHLERAKGGLALTMTAGSAMVSQDSPPAFGNLLAYKDEIVPWLKRLARIASARPGLQPCAPTCSSVSISSSEGGQARGRGVCKAQGAREGACRIAYEEGYPRARGGSRPQGGLRLHRHRQCAAATKLVTRLEELATRLAETPGMGRARAELLPDLRCKGNGGGLAPVDSFATTSFATKVLF